MWGLWVLGGLVVWLVAASVVAIVLGRSIRLADRRSVGDPADALGASPLDADPGAAPSPAPERTSGAGRAQRRRVPLPPIGVALAGLGVVLETVGFALRLSGARGRLAELLSMDAPLSLPRMYVTALFAAAAVAALTGAGRMTGRRSWWVAVGVVAAAICSVKAGGTIHAAAMGWLGRSVGRPGALVVSVLVAAAVVGGLWYLARGERRDRLRVLGTLAFYALASVGLSGVSASVTGARAATVATYLEESGEALGAVAFLVAVLVGVAPRLALPAEWALRRSADAETLGIDEPGSLRPAVEPR